MWIGKQANALFDEGNSGMVAPSNKNINMQGRPRKKSKGSHSEAVDGDESEGSTKS